MTHQEEEYYLLLGEALDKREAFRRGMTLEEYRAADREETIRYAATTLGITPEEVVAQGIHKNGRSFILMEKRRRKLSETVGRDATFQEVLDEDVRQLRESNYPTPECIQPSYELEEYTKTGTLPADRLSHLETCASCYAMAAAAREGYLTNTMPPGPECLTEEEQRHVETVGRLPENRTLHAQTCKRCKRKFRMWQEKYLNRAIPLPEWVGPLPRLKFS